MYVITADQIRSRRGADQVGPTIQRLTERHGADLMLPADRTAGDEMQMPLAEAGPALDIVLDLVRSRQWSVGLGLGDVQEPLPATTREATGTAFIAARDAVTAAKRRPLRFALALAPDRAHPVEHIEPLIELLLQLRERRTEPGWDVYDLLEAGSSQLEAAARLGITPQAVSHRVQVAALHLDRAARRSLTVLLRDADRPRRDDAPPGRSAA